MSTHVATTEVYERKAELGGGWRGSVRDRETKETQTGIFPSRDEALSFVKKTVHARYANRGYKTASIRFKKGSTSYRANIWA